MAKFEVMVTEHIQRSVAYTINISKKKVVEALGLEGEDAKDWKEHVQEYVEQEWETIRADANAGDVGDEDEVSFDIDDVTDLEE